MGAGRPINRKHGFVHVRNVDQPVSVMGVQVFPNDIVHADRPPWRCGCAL